MNSNMMKTIKNIIYLKTIDLSRLQKGVYIMKVSGDNFEFTEKIILN